MELRPFVEVDTCLPVNVLIQPNTTAGGPLQGYWLTLEAEPQVLQAGWLVGVLRYRQKSPDMQAFE